MNTPKLSYLLLFSVLYICTGNILQADNYTEADASYSVQNGNDIGAVKHKLFTLYAPKYRQKYNPQTRTGRALNYVDNPQTSAIIAAIFHELPVVTQPIINTLPITDKTKESFNGKIQITSRGGAEVFGSNAAQLLILKNLHKPENSLAGLKDGALYSANHALVFAITETDKGQKSLAGLKKGASFACKKIGGQRLWNSISTAYATKISKENKDKINVLARIAAAHTLTYLEHLAFNYTKKLSGCSFNFSLKR